MYCDFTIYLKLLEKIFVHIHNVEILGDVVRGLSSTTIDLYSNGNKHEKNKKVDYFSDTQFDFVKIVITHLISKARAKILRNNLRTLTSRETSREWITSVGRRTATNWIVVDHSTLGSNTTRTGAWISTFLVEACFTRVTVGVDSTFWSASWRTSQITNNTRTYSLVIYLTTLTIRSTW